MQQRLIIEVCQGRAKGQKAVIAAGERLRVGRTERADFVVPKDGKLSGVHFELRWDGVQCQLRDNGSKTGTLLGGEAVTTAWVPHGSWLRAGATDFMVYYEGHTPARRNDGDAEPEPRRKALSLARPLALQMLQAEAARTPLYALLDAARTPRVLEMVRESVQEYRSLYDGIEGETLADAAPYLVRLPAGSRLLPQLVEEGWGRRWGIFVSAKRRFKEVRRHLRRFLMVTLEASETRVYFRFYDPRVMDVFWQSSTVRQRQEMMAELTALLFETRRDAMPLRVEAA